MPKKKFRVDFDTLRRIPIVTVAEALGLPLIKTGPGTWAVKDDRGRASSLVLFEKNNRWKKFSADLGGSTIDLVMYKKNCELQEAAEFLSRYA